MLVHCQYILQQFQQKTDSITWDGLIKIKNRCFNCRETETFEDVADFYSVLGLEGVFMASVLVNPGSAVKGSPEKRLFQTVITYNKGVSWEPVVVPAEQSTGPMCDADKVRSKRLKLNFYSLPFWSNSFS